jgi:biopolymer transport protein ExbD/biopolymer transport protein TolR
MAIADRSSSHNVNSNINVTPMVDVMLVLLIIFMVITPMLTNKVSIELAQVKNPIAMPDAEKDDAIVVAITRDGKYFLGQNLVAPNQLGQQVADRLANKTDKTVFFRADARAQFKAVEDAIDNVRTAGVDQADLLTQKIENSMMAGGD